MAFELTIDGYTFDNPPSTYRKRIALGNSPQPHYEKTATPYYRSDSQQITLELSGRLSLNDQGDLDELERIQEKAIEGGEVDVQFDPFFSGTGVIEDEPVEQENQRGRYTFSIAINEETTDATAYPAHATPTTGNTFELGNFDFGFDPESVSQEYERQTERVDRLQGVAHTSDTKGLVTRVSLDGRVDGGGQAELWEKARENAMAYLTAEFQNGWALLNTLSVSKDDATPDYLRGLFRYSAEFLIVKDPTSGIGETSQFINHDVGDSGTYTSDGDSGTGSDEGGLDFKVLGGTGSVDGRYIDWVTTTITLDDDTTNYVFVDDSDGDGQGTVAYQTGDFPASDALPLYEVDTSNGEIVDVRDVRDSLLGTGDDTTSDFIFRDEFSIDDTAFTYAQLLQFADAVGDPTLAQSYLGKADLPTESIADPTEGPILPALGVATLSETLAVDDGGSATTGGGGGGTEETSTWETTSDWDNAVSDSSTYHASSTLKMGISADDFDDYGSGVQFPGNWSDPGDGAYLETTTARSYSGNQSATAGSDSNFDQIAVASGFAAEPYDVFKFKYYETSSNSETGIRINDANGNEIGGAFTDNPQVTGVGANGQSDIESSPSPDYDVWREFEFVFDWANDQFTLNWYDLEGSTGDRSQTFDFVNSATELGEIVATSEYSGGWSFNEGFIDDVWSGFHDSSITTATKSFSSEVQPDLTNLDYSLNSQSVTIDVIGSPGTASEETKSVSLDGSTSYTLNWSNAHTDFRVAIDMASADQVTTPTVNSVSLTGTSDGGGGSGADSDQNARTTWTIGGAKYDTSGNEYEGGGVVSEYGG